MASTPEPDSVTARTRTIGNDQRQGMSVDTPTINSPEPSEATVASPHGASSSDLPDLPDLRPSVTRSVVAASRPRDDGALPPLPPGNSDHGSYIAALVATAIFIPFTFLTLAISFYCVHLNVLVRWNMQPNPYTRNAVNVLLAILGALLMWALFALWFRQFTTAAHANPGVYGELQGRYDDLRAHQRTPLVSYSSADTGHVPPTEAQQASVDAAYRQACAQASIAAGLLTPRTRDLRWVSAAGYLAMWHTIHRAEEKFLLSDPLEEVFAQARTDELRLKDSRIDASDDLLATLRYALGDQQSPTLTTLPKHPLSELQQRALLQEVRKAINVFRDGKRDGLVRARNRLVTTVFVAGLVASLLLALAMAALPDEAANRRSIITAGIVFLVGAIIGLFNQLRLDAQTDDAVEDYGLATARKVNTPLFSGLAAVFGVLITVLLPGALESVVPTPAATMLTPASAPMLGVSTPAAVAAVGATGTNTSDTRIAPVALPARSVPLIQVYDMASYPFEVVIAMIFGLTPGLLISRLQQHTEGYKADLASTEAVTQNAGFVRG